MQNSLQMDLHVHSNYSSDGELRIKEIVNLCISKKINILSITDHNSVLALDEAVPACLDSRINLIPGIEIDCSYKNTDLHLLGYNISWQSTDFSELKESIDKKIMDSFPAMVENLEKSGIKVDANEVLEKADGKLPCGELIAEVLLTNNNYHSNKKLIPYLKGGKRSDMPYINFYHDFFAQGKPAYVKTEYMDFMEALELIKSNSGIPIIAHPGLNFKGKEALVTELLNNGAEGLEVFNNYHNNTQMEYFAYLAVQGSFLITCGSDFHGKNKPLIDIGKYGVIDKYSSYLKESIIHLNKKTAY